jgi:hypothetical protein
MFTKHVRRSMTGLLVLFAAAACSGNPAPVPLLGDPGDIAQLAGTWMGEYWSPESGRSGSITFSLKAGADTAFGDVLMIPSDQPHTHTGAHPASEFLAITFVRVDAGRVRGRLDPYRDPVCGCRLETTFDGTIRPDTVAGTYTSRHIEGGDVQHGQWRVIRRR